MLQAGSFSTRSWAGHHDRSGGPQTLPSGCAKVEGCGETQRGGDEEAIRRWERPLMRDRQAGEIRSGE